ncbi:MAG TPA: hypothetical protein VEC16_07160 [Alphaproteobacteria bacterium]|nr:hypothetical protein [Alphaproteobacteria bacterium]
MSRFPQIILPGKSEEYKIMQFLVGNEPYLRFAPVNTDTKGFYHYHILDRFALETDTKTKTIKIRDFDVSAFVDENYKISGAGACDVYLEEKIAIFGSISAGYNIGVNVNHLNEMAKLMPDWKFLHNTLYNRRDRDIFPEYKKYILKQ